MNGKSDWNPPNGDYIASADGANIYIGAYNHWPWTIYHEYAHNIIKAHHDGWLGTDHVLDEAMADYFSCSILNDPTPPLYYLTRNLENNLVYNNRFDYSVPYGRAQILSGACWDLRSSLGASTTNALVYETIGSLGSNESMCDFMDELLLSDDNDGDITNGTPNASDIFTAFHENHHIMGNYLGGELGVNLTYSSPIYIIEDLTIPDGRTLSLGSNVTVYVRAGKKINVYGELHVQDGVTFTKAASGSYWSGIDLRSGGYFDVHGDITIEQATCGVDFYGGTISNGTNTITVQNCSTVGVCVNSGAGSPDIQNINLINAGTVYGSIACVGGSASIPPVYKCTSQGSKYALYIGSNCSASVDWYDIKNTHTSEPINAPYPSSVSLNGTNNIIKAAGVARAINNGTTGWIDAKNNWWGVNPPPSTYFAFPSSTYIDYSSAEDNLLLPTETGIYKMTIEEKESFELAQELEFAGKLSNAIEMYESLLKSENNPWKKKLIITSMLRAVNNGEKNYDYLKVIVENELKTADSYYEATLDALLCELLINEGKYQDAIDGLYEKIQKYKGTSIEVEFLARISLIYSDNLKDNAKALTVADMAASINAGQEVLRAVYESAGQEFCPWEYTNEFKDEVELKKISEEELDQSITENNDVSISPNPFNPSTTISYSIVQDSHVSLCIYNLSGQKVATLVDSSMPAGTHHAVFNGSNLASGIYFYRFESGNTMKNGKMLLMK